jgi:hypothetical protein
MRAYSFEQCLRGLSVAFGILAALFWLRSAFVQIPLLPGAAIGGTLPEDAFNVALHDAARWNFLAAAATAISVLLPAVAEGVRWFRGQG